jgi:hypothetical protein
MLRLSSVTKRGLHERAPFSSVAAERLVAHCTPHERVLGLTRLPPIGTTFYFPVVAHLPRHARPPWRPVTGVLAVIIQL